MKKLHSISSKKISNITTMIGPFTWPIAGEDRTVYAVKFSKVFYIGELKDGRPHGFGIEKMISVMVKAQKEVLLVISMKGSGKMAILNS